MRPVVIVLLDPTSDGSPRFFQALVLRRPDLFFLQAAMEPLDGPDFSRTTSPAPLTEFLWSTTISAVSDCHRAGSLSFVSRLTVLLLRSEVAVDLMHKFL